MRLSSSGIASSSIDAGCRWRIPCWCASPNAHCSCCVTAQVLRTYKIALGLRPEGHKQYEGDFRTPEGKYTLTRRNPNSEYFLSIQVSLPERRDMARARKQGVRPGGAIMIHGQPNVPRKPRDYYTQRRLDRRLHRGVELRHGRDLADDAAGTPIEIQP